MDDIIVLLQEQEEGKDENTKGLMQEKKHLNDLKELSK